MRILVVLLAALLWGSRSDNESIVLSVSAWPSVASLSEPVSLVITLRNRSDAPRYVPRNVDPTLDFAVRDGDGRLLRGFMHPPSNPRIPSDSRDWVRIEGKKAYRCLADLPLEALGIERAGVFAVTGFWSGRSAKVPTVDWKAHANHFEHAEDTYLTVTAARITLDVGSRTTSQTVDGELPKCLAAGAEPG